MVERNPVQVRRAYDELAPGDGVRVLVDRLWPRGLSRDRARLDEWDRAVAPSTALRRWYGHAPERFEEFAERYRAELEDPERAAALRHLRELAGDGPLTLLTATKDPAISAAAVLADLLRGGDRSGAGGPGASRLGRGGPARQDGSRGPSRPAPRGPGTEETR